jgi:hypothetical protein
VTVVTAADPAFLQISARQTTQPGDAGTMKDGPMIPPGSAKNLRARCKQLKIGSFADLGVEDRRDFADPFRIFIALVTMTIEPSDVVNDVLSDAPWQNPPSLNRRP